MASRVLPGFLGKDRHDNSFLSSDLGGTVKIKAARSFSEKLQETLEPPSADSLEDGVGVQVHTHHVSGGVVEVKVAGVDAHDEGHGRQQDVGHLQRTQRDVGTDPAQREAHLGPETHTHAHTRTHGEHVQSP